MKAFHLQTEPWLFAINRRGIIAARLEGAFGTDRARRCAACGAAMRPIGAAPGAADHRAGRGRLRLGSSAAGQRAARWRPPASSPSAGFTPAATVPAGQPTTISFTVREPSGAALTQYKTGPGPHTGVHLIIVRDDLAYIIHDHPPISSERAADTSG